MKDIKLINPTVGDIINLLNNYPKDKPFRIDDADTNWIISVIHVSNTDECLSFFGEYDEMDENMFYKETK